MSASFETDQSIIPNFLIIFLLFVVYCGKTKDAVMRLAKNLRFIPRYQSLHVSVCRSICSPKMIRIF